MDFKYRNKYLKYKTKYIKNKINKHKGGSSTESIPTIFSWNITNPDLSVNIFEFLSHDNKDFLELVDKKFKEYLSKDVKTLLFFKGNNDTDLQQIFEKKQTYLNTLLQHNNLNESYYNDHGKSINDMKILINTKLLQSENDWSNSTVRLEYYKKQSISQFLIQDGSGGATVELDHFLHNLNYYNPYFKFDENLWKTGSLGSITKKVTNNPKIRVGTDNFLETGTTTNTTDFDIKSYFLQYDLIKLFIFDLILTEVCYFAKQDWLKTPNTNFEELKEKSNALKDTVVRWTTINNKIQSANCDLYVLIELPGQKIDNLPYLKDKNFITNSDIYLFYESPIVKIGKHKHFLIGCIGNYIIICVHLPSNKKELDKIGESIESIMNKPEYEKKQLLYIAGDFNFDIYKDSQQLNQFTSRSKILKDFFTTHNSYNKFDENMVSCKKQRTPLQPQVTKIGVSDISAKDFIISPYKQTTIGYIHKKDGPYLPNSECPSDHTPIYLTINK